MTRTNLDSRQIKLSAADVWVNVRESQVVSSITDSMMQVVSVFFPLSHGVILLRSVSLSNFLLPLLCLSFCIPSAPPLSLSSNRCSVRREACRSKCSHQSYSPAQQLNSASVHSLLQRPPLLSVTFILDNNSFTLPADKILPATSGPGVYTRVCKS